MAMQKMRIMITAGMLLLISTTAHSQTRIDRKWWKSASPEMHRGVISGAFDCLTAEWHVKLPMLTVPEMDERTDAAMAQAGEKETLASVLQRIPKVSTPEASGGEDYSKERHGWFDGYYWGSAPDKERYGFLVGYLSCGDTLRASGDHVKEYRKQIDDWYDQHPSSNEKVADVLARVRHRNLNSRGEREK
jgi:hypothetical protein